MVAPPANLVFVPTAGVGASLREDVYAGLSLTQKSLPAKWFYDALGSELFEAICELPEYYVTRTETAILSEHLEEIAGSLPTAGTLIEPGSGAGIKTRLLIRSTAPSTYVAIDISHSMLELGAAQTAREFPALQVVAIHADYTALERLPNDVALGDEPRTLYFPGSTIGNFTAQETRTFLERVACWIGARGSVLIGVDTRKDSARLEAAYDDRQGITARFNLNLLTRLNAELDAGFILERFRHRARYDAALGRVEMHLESRVDQQVWVGGRLFQFRAGETIHTENSYKYAPSEFVALAAQAGYVCRRYWSDAAGAFAIYHLLPSSRPSPVDA